MGARVGWGLCLRPEPLGWTFSHPGAPPRPPFEGWERKGLLVCDHRAQAASEGPCAQSVQQVTCRLLGR